MQKIKNKVRWIKKEKIDRILNITQSIHKFENLDEIYGLGTGTVT